MATNTEQRRMFDRKLGEVIVLDETPAMLQLRTVHGGDEFWYPKEKLLPVQVKRSRGLENRLLREELQKDLPAGFMTMEELLAYINSTEYSFFLATNGAHLEEAREAYFNWTGEDLPRAAIKMSENRYGTCWILCFRHQLGNRYPFPVTQMGQNDGKKQEQPVGLATKQWVYMEYVDVIERLVRLGLRIS